VIYLLFIFFIYLSVFIADNILAQNVNYQIFTTRYYTGRGNSDFWTTDDPKCRVLFYDNTDGYSNGIVLIQPIDNGLDGVAWYYPADFECRNISNSNFTSKFAL
jgi:hypothetical protein